MNEVQVEGMYIPESAGLDGITVFWQNYEPGRGAVTLTVWGSAWTCSFGAMSGETIQEFFAKADVSYLVNKLGITPRLKQSKREEVYLGRIVTAVKKSLADGAK